MSEKKNKLRNCIFADTENVGYSLGSIFPKKTDLYFYLTQKEKALILPVWLSTKRFHIQDLHENFRNGKNELDIFIMEELAVKIASDSYARRKKTRYIVLSRDKGYDLALQALREKYPEAAAIERMEKTAFEIMHQLAAEQMDDRKLPDLIVRHPELKEKYASCSRYSLFRSSLSAEELKLVRIYPDPDEMNLWIEYDFYENRYLVFCSGMQKKACSSLEQAEAFALETGKHLKKKAKKKPVSKSEQKKQRSRKTIRSLDELKFEEEMVKELLQENDAGSTPSEPLALPVFLTPEKSGPAEKILTGSSPALEDFDALPGNEAAKKAEIKENDGLPESAGDVGPGHPAISFQPEPPAILSCTEPDFADPSSIYGGRPADRASRPVSSDPLTKPLFLRLKWFSSKAAEAVETAILQGKESLVDSKQAEELDRSVPDPASIFGGDLDLGFTLPKEGLFF